MELPGSPAVSRYLVYYWTEGSFFRRSRSVPASQSEITLTGLVFGAEYNLTVVAQVRFTYCFSYVSSPESDVVMAITTETG